MLINAMINNPLSVAREMDRLFDRMIASQPHGFVPSIRTQWTYPAINLWEDDDNFYAEAELPGLTMDDIEAFVTENDLTIRGSRNVNVPEEATPLRRERAVGSFERTINMPASVDAEHVEAKFTDGILAITLPKSEQCKPRRISVKTTRELPHAS